MNPTSVRMDKIKILMLGESLSKQGGIVLEEQLIIHKILPKVQIRHIAILVSESNLLYNSIMKPADCGCFSQFRTFSAYEFQECSFLV